MIKASLQVRNMDKVKLMLRNIAERVPDGARKQMHKSAEEIVRVAKIQTPRDWGNLEDAIKIIKSYGERGRLQIDIGIQPTGDEVGENGPIDVNQYAAIIHENYEYVIRKNGPGKKTLRKMAQYPGYRIGSGFLTRAAMLQQKSLDKQMVAVIDRIVKEEDK